MWQSFVRYKYQPNANRCLCTLAHGLKPANGRDVTERAIIDVNSIVSEGNYDI